MKKTGLAMNGEELKRYNEAQIAEIMVYKWIQSEKLKRDIGFQQAAFEWIDNFAGNFRKEWFTKRIMKHNVHEY